MPLLTLPTKSPSSIEDFVILSLSQRQPLSAKELFGEVKRHGIDVSYQAVHKKLQDLQKQRVLLSDGKRYSINRQWVLDAKVFLEKMDSELLKSAEKAERKEAVCLSFDSYNDFGTHMLREFAKERNWSQVASVLPARSIFGGF